MYNLCIFNIHNVMVRVKYSFIFVVSELTMNPITYIVLELEIILYIYSYITITGRLYVKLIIERLP